MYIPAHFAESEPAALTELIAANNFATLVSNVDGRPFATHLPFLYAPDENVLYGHMARANPHWAAFEDEANEALVIFQGPHDYVSPGWYAEPGVPTWNYAAVHVYGTFEAITEAALHEQILRDLTAQHEAGNPTPWRADFDAPLVAGMVRGTVAFRIAVTAIEGKFKLSQNRSPVDRERVIAALEERAGEQSLQLAALMRSRS